jgi:hypothetical protein
MMPTMKPTGRFETTCSRVTDSMATEIIRLHPFLSPLFDGFKCDEGADKYYFSIDDQEDINGTHLRNYYYDAFFQIAKEQKPEGIIVSRAYSPHQEQNPDDVGAPISASPINWQGDYCGDFIGLEEQMNHVYTSAEKGYGAPEVDPNVA